MTRIFSEKISTRAAKRPELECTGPVPAGGRFPETVTADTAPFACHMRRTQPNRRTLQMPHQMVQEQTQRTARQIYEPARHLPVHSAGAKSGEDAVVPAVRQPIGP
ncbi:hypothetical protein NRF20_43575 [Streptomyces sp. R-74717]|uniref:hypothetical protein n=1 Tax=Streptomyces TaxID=1883 RepID=UPI00378C3037